jgi:glycine hydroxymethyltransferase
MAAIKSVLNTEDTILGMNLDDGGHLTHGSKVSFSGKDYYSYSYGLDERGNIDYADIEKQLELCNPNVLIVGASSYSGKIDFERIRTIVDFYNSGRTIEYIDVITEQPVFDQPYCYIIADIAHIAGLVATGLHQSPIPYADIITTTTHKTLRGPRGGVIMTNDFELSKKIDKAVFPGIQGGPILQVIAAKAQCFTEALEPNFILYQKQVLANIQAMKKIFDYNDIPLIGECLNHLLLLDLSEFEKSGKQIANELEYIGIIVNKNSIKNDLKTKFETSGIRIGTPLITTQGYSEDDCAKIAQIISNVIKKDYNKDELKEQVNNIIKREKNAEINYL